MRVNNDDNIRMSAMEFKLSQLFDLVRFMAPDHGILLRKCCGKDTVTTYIVIIFIQGSDKQMV